MALPTSRDETIVASGKIPASVLNNLQDCVVGKKHGTVEQYFHASIAVSSGWTWVFDECIYRTSTADVDIVVPILLPVGAVLEEVDLFVKSETTAANLDCYVGESTIYQESIGTVKGVAKSPSTTANETVSWTSADADFPLTIVTARRYAIQIVSQNTTQKQFYGGRLQWHMP